MLMHDLRSSRTKKWQKDNLFRCAAIKKMLRECRGYEFKIRIEALGKNFALNKINAEILISIFQASLLNYLA